MTTISLPDSQCAVCGRQDGPIAPSGLCLNCHNHLVYEVETPGPTDTELTPSDVFGLIQEVYDTELSLDVRQHNGREWIEYKGHFVSPWGHPLDIVAFLRDNYIGIAVDHDKRQIGSWVFPWSRPHLIGALSKAKARTDHYTSEPGT